MDNILFTKELIMKNRYLFDFEITEEDIDTVLTEYLVEQTIARALDYCISEELSGEEFKCHKHGFIIGYIGEHIKIRKKALEENNIELLKILDAKYL